MKTIFLCLILFVAQTSWSEPRRLDPREDEKVEGLLLSRQGVKDGIKWVLVQSYEGSSIDPEHSYATRAIPLPEGVDPQTHVYQEHFLLYSTYAWNYLCQVRVRLLWKFEGEAYSIDESHSDQVSDNFCYPRI